MSKKTGLFLDFSEFSKNFIKLTEETMPMRAKVGEFEAANEVLNDSVEIPPQAPKEIGDLWGSRIVKAEKEKKKEIVTIFGFNIKYAARHHEVAPGTFTYTTDKGAKRPGPKFMQSKMAMFKKKYIQIVANAIKRARV